jgi:hypothetical protein
MRSITNNSTIISTIVFAFVICSNNMTTAINFNTKEKQRSVPSLRGSHNKGRDLQGEEPILSTPNL